MANQEVKMTDQEFAKLSVQEQYAYYLGCGHVSCLMFTFLYLPLFSAGIIMRDQ